MADKHGHDVTKAGQGRGDRLALMRLYDELDDAGKQELLRLARRLARKDQG